MSELDEKTFAQFRSYVYEKSGIALGPQKKALVSARIGKRMRALNIGSYAAYLDYVRKEGQGAELVEMIDAISTNTTSFFRESSHFDLLAELLPKWRQAGQRRFRLWCAAASSGEEPYTLAMVMHEALDPRAHDFKLLATDISTRVLKACMQAVYSAEKVKTVSAPLRERYFERAAEPGLWRVKKPLRDCIKFRRLNLAEPPFPMKGPLDAIFCRNVMIYFDNKVRGRLVDEAYRLLKPGGYLFVGHAESLTGLTTRFRSVQPSVYMK